MKLASRISLLFSLGVLLVLPFHARGQSFEDIYRYSRYANTGTARSMGLAGAYSAVGADFSAAALNPAGIGMYRSTELSISLATQIGTTTTQYIDQQGSDVRVNVALPNFSAVLYGRKKVYNGTDGERPFAFRSWALGFGMNQVDNYHNRSTVTAFNPNSSMTWWMANEADLDGNPDPDPSLNRLGYYSRLAYDAVLIDTFLTNQTPTGLGYEPSFASGQVDQRVSRTDRGRWNEFSLTLGGNWGDNLFAGVALNISDILFQRDFSILETDSRDIYPNFIQSGELSDFYRTSGWGLGATFGVIYQPLQFMRLGLSFRTPTVLFLRDNFSTRMIGTFDDGQQFEGSYADEDFTFPYQVTTPFRATLGTAFFVRKLLMFTVDADLTDGRTIRFANSPSSNSQGNFTLQNALARNNMMLAYTLRSGVELRLKRFYLRAGFAWQSATAKPQLQEYSSVLNPTDIRRTPGYTLHYAGGLGFRSKHLFVDMAVNAQDRSTPVVAYPLFDNQGVSPTLDMRRLMVQVMVTLGVRITPKR